MIKKLRIKFVTTTLALLAVIFILGLGLLNIFFVGITSNGVNNFLREIIKNDMILERGSQEDIWFLTKNAESNLYGIDDIDLSEMYSVRITQDGQTAISRSLGINSISNEEMQVLLTDIITSKKTKGVSGEYRFYMEQKPYGKAVLIINSKSELRANFRLLITSIFIAVGILGVLAIALIIISKFITKPVEESYSRQKRFIADASHELKTPLSTISVNADALQAEIGENKWLGYIKSEAIRMDKLVKALLTMAQMDEKAEKLQKEKFNLTDAVYEIILPFESVAFEKKIEFIYNIEENCFYNGDKESIKKLIAILVENAFQHTNENFKVEINLKNINSKNILKVKNYGSSIDEEDLPHIFDRFYRCDKARTDSGNFGLGLAIAQNIANLHNTKIEVESEKDKLTIFKVNL